MGYTHYFTNVKDVPDPQWKVLCEKVSEAFDWVQNQYFVYQDHPHRPIVICDGHGEKVITNSHQLFLKSHRGSQVICFNGDASQRLEHESFYLPQKKLDDFNFCKTAQKPYDWFVVVVLILAHNLCPDCFNIASDGGTEEWAPVAQWLNQRSGIEYLMPLAVVSRIFSGDD